MALTMQALVKSEGSDPKYIYGIDISVYQGKAKTINWQKVVDSGCMFAYCKATEGPSIKDSQFRDNYVNLGEYLPRGPYHFFRGGSNGIKQAENFLEQVEDIYDSNDLPPCIDLESANSKVPISTQIQYALEWSQIVQDRLKVKPIIYTSLRVIRDIYCNTEAFTHMPLWTVDYRLSPSIPKMPPGYNDWVFWQFSDKCVVPGINSPCDVDRFNGNGLDLAQFIADSHI